MTKEQRKKRLAELKIDIGKYVKVRRKAHKLSQIEMADRMGISQAHISKVENGLAQLTASQWRYFCEQFKVSL